MAGFASLFFSQGLFLALSNDFPVDAVPKDWYNKFDMHIMLSQEE